MWKTFPKATIAFTNMSKIISLNKISSQYFTVYPACSRLNFNNKCLYMKPITVTQIRTQYKSVSNQPDLKTSLHNEGKSNKEDPKKEKQSSFLKFLAAFSSGVIAYFAITIYLDNRTKKSPTKGAINYSSEYLPGRVKPSKSIIKENNPGNIKLTLYQYVTCPFCCKVRAYLDYFGFSYDIVEVNSINKKQTNWSDYKRVPILAVQVPSKNDPDKYDEEIMQLNDSAVIISALETYRLDSSKSLKQIKTYFEPLEFANEKNANSDYVNKYFVMLYDQNVFDGKDVNERKLEREWREWVDTKFLHAISPNVYRTLSESLAAFDWYRVVGDWDSQFNSFEKLSIHYIGALVMYVIGKRLKSKYELKVDVRQSLYEFADEWVNSLNGKFKGGNQPNLADLSLYGVISSFRGCKAFDDMVQNSKIKSWYEACQEQVENSQGRVLLNNSIKNKTKKQNNTNNVQSDSPKQSKRFGIF